MTKYNLESKLFQKSATRLQLGRKNLATRSKNRFATRSFFCNSLATRFSKILQLVFRRIAVVALPRAPNFQILFHFCFSRRKTLACQEGLLYTNLEIDADDDEVEFDMAEMIELDNMSKRAQRLEK
tara:strand:+ start:313 stop:690 length:378 start_codon:yes stop_codon:yes gene_type:complete